MKRYVLLFAFCVLAWSVFAQKTDKKLQAKIEALVKDFHGHVGIYIKDLKRNTIAGIDGDSIFPTASMIKVPILIGIMDQIRTGALQYHQELIYNDSLLYAGVDLLGSFKSGEKIELSKLLMLMLSMSDNTASLWLQSLAGTGTRINELLDSFGLYITRVNSRTLGREANRTVYGWGQTSPKEMTFIFEKLYRGSILSDSLSTKMLRLLGRSYWDEEALSQIPATIQVFSKSGAVDESRSEVLLVNAPHHPYVFCICTNNNKDQRWESDNEAWVLTRKLSALLWVYFGD